MTNSSICSFMSGLFELSGFEDKVRILDPGAGIGSLTASLVEKISSVLGDIKLEVNAYEIDSVMRSVFSRLQHVCLKILRQRFDNS